MPEAETRSVGVSDLVCWCPHLMAVLCATCCCLLVQFAASARPAEGQSGDGSSEGSEPSGRFEEVELSVSEAELASRVTRDSLVISEADQASHVTEDSLLARDSHGAPSASRAAATSFHLISSHTLH